MSVSLWRNYDDLFGINSSLRKMVKFLKKYSYKGTLISEFRLKSLVYPK